VTDGDAHRGSYRSRRIRSAGLLASGRSAQVSTRKDSLPFVGLLHFRFPWQDGKWTLHARSQALIVHAIRTTPKLGLPFCVFPLEFPLCQFWVLGQCSLMEASTLEGPSQYFNDREDQTVFYTCKCVYSYT